MLKYQFFVLPVEHHGFHDQIHVLLDQVRDIHAFCPLSRRKFPPKRLVRLDSDHRARDALQQRLPVVGVGVGFPRRFRVENSILLLDQLVGLPTKRQVFIQFIYERFLHFESFLSRPGHPARPIHGGRSSKLSQADYLG